MAKQKKEVRQLSRKEVSDMLGQLPIADQGLLELTIDVLMRAVDNYPKIVLSKLNNAIIDLAYGFETGDKKEEGFIKAEKYLAKCGFLDYVQEQLQDMYE